MRIDREDLEWAARQRLLDDGQVGPLWAGLGERTRGREGDGSPDTAAEEGGLGFETAAYALGTVLVLVALGWFTQEAWQLWGDGVMTALVAGYAVMFAWVGAHLLSERDRPVAGGLFLALAVSIVPLVVLGILRTAGLWSEVVVPPGTVAPRVQLQFVLMELATLGAGAVALRRWKTPLLQIPLSLAAWGLILNAAPLIAGAAAATVDGRRTLSAIFGVLLIGAAMALDRRASDDDEDRARWPYLIGLIALWGATTLGGSESELLKAGYLAMNVALMFLSVLLGRIAFIVFGTFGVFLYLLDVSNRLFGDSLLFPVSLIAIGVSIILGGVAYRWHRERIEAWAREVVPPALRRWLPERRR